MTAVVYELAYIDNLNDHEAGNWLTWLLVSAAHAVTGGRWPDRHGWILWDVSAEKNVVIASNMQICADEGSCADAKMWAADEILMYGGERVAQWVDATDESGIFFIGESASALKSGEATA